MFANQISLALVMALGLVVLAAAIAAGGEELEKEFGHRADFRPLPLLTGTAPLLLTLCFVLAVGGLVLYFAASVYYGWLEIGGATCWRP